MTSDPAWYQTGVFYEVAVHSFQDGNADGVGDIAGLVQRLDYIQDLGITGIWMLPILQSPMRDGGYDVSDFTGVRPEYGTLDDVRTLIHEAHSRGLKVITDFIVNHSSDQHPWFVEARNPASPKHDWYVWSEDKNLYNDARVIFVDTHTSNWTWDDVADKYYWHRFFDHQPDLNFANADLRKAMMDAIRFWLDLGFDGMRLDAVPYLFEEDGTNCENLPATHTFLKEVREMVDREYEGRALLAEANQWPADLLPYFGNGDECHMAFHFPVMPRLFLALATGDTTPIIDVLSETPDIPQGTQWAVFLRNHDELTLEMVSDEDRETLNAAYAPDPAMRKNIGIRRRLAPLLANDMRRIELLNAVLMSLPGTPVVYYGDEIGMGDTVALEDRDGVRTPMQWEPTRSAGWSDANPQDFYLPVVDSPSYAPAKVNVADQSDDPSSLLSFMKTLIAVRGEIGEMGTAPFHALATGHAGVLGFARGDVSVAANFTDEPISIPWVDGSLIAGNATVAETAATLPAYGWLWMTGGKEPA
ncbi:MAG: maltose alpha-D-glucosyltransferase [Acidimicrobiia bacterium]